MQSGSCVGFAAALGCVLGGLHSCLSHSTWLPPSMAATDSWPARIGRQESARVRPFTWSSRAQREMRFVLVFLSVLDGLYVKVNAEGVKIENSRIQRR